MALNKRTRRVALIGPLGDRRLAVHTAGYPMDPERMLPPADVILLIGDAKDGAMLFRYTSHGELCGDTPHVSITEAVQEAGLEYGEALLDWIDVPPDVEDAHAFAVQYASDQLNQRE